jgi:hypothetical protein
VSAASQASIRDEIARIAEMIGAARQFVSMGANVDLAPLGEGIVRLCGVVGALPREDGVELRNELETLMTRLGGLGSDIDACLARVGAACEQEG